MLHCHPNGISSGKINKITISLCRMKGKNDHNLPFPFSGIFTIQLLNWKQDSHHVERMITFDEHTPLESRKKVTIGAKATKAWGEHQYLSHQSVNLDVHKSKDKDKEYINLDMACFRIQFHPLPETIRQKGQWLSDVL